MNFNRSWVDYREGFGNRDGEHWLGNKYIHALTKLRRAELLVQLEDWDENTRYQVYNEFSVLSEENRFQLILDDDAGSAKDALQYQNYDFFSTFDRDYDDQEDMNLAANYSSGFWFERHSRPYFANLNGPYQFSHSIENAGNGIIWSRFRGSGYSLKKTEMKVRARPLD